MLDKLSKLSGYDLKIKINDVKHLRLKESGEISIFVLGLKVNAAKKNNIKFLNEAEKILKAYGGNHIAPYEDNTLFYIFSNTTKAPAAEISLTAALKIISSNKDVSIAVGSCIINTSKSAVQSRQPYKNIERLLSLSRAGQILISEKDADSLRKAFYFEGALSEQPDILVVKHLTSPQRKLSPFAGRQAELEQLKIIYNEARNTISPKNAKPVLAGIKGEAGIGKSRFITEFIERSSSYENILAGKASRVLGEPYDIFTSALRNVAGISEADTRSERKSKLEALYKALTPKITNKKEAVRLKQSKPIIGYLLGIDYADTRLKLEAKELQNHIDISLRHFIEAYADTVTGEAPLLFVIEDCHWMDNISKESIQYILSTFNIEKKRENKPLSKVMFIMLYRPEFEPGRKLEKEVQFTEIQLQPLDENASSQIIRGLVQANNGKYSELVLQKSLGNPLFIEEWVSHFIEQSHEDGETPVKVRGKYHTAKGKTIPGNITTLVQMRIDRLKKEQKLLLQKASVLGKSFSWKVIYEIEKKFDASHSLDEMLEQLCVKDFIYSIQKPGQTAEERVYSFKHDIIQEVTYDYTLSENRKIIHRIAAEVLEEQFKNELQNHYFELAEHYSKTDSEQKAILYLQKAGDKAKEEYKNELAIELYNKLLRCLEREMQNNKIYAVLINKGEVLLHVGRWDEGIKVFNEALVIAGKLNDNIRTANSFHSIGKAFYLKNKLIEAFDNFSKALKIFRKLGYKQGVLINLDFIGKVYLQKAEYKEAKKYYEKHLAISKELSDENHIAQGYFNLGVLNRRQSNYDIALRYLNQNLSIVKKLGEIHRIAYAYNAIGSIYFYKGDLDSALLSFENSLRLNKQFGSRLGTASALGNIGAVYMCSNNIIKAKNFYKQQKKIYLELNDKIGLAAVFGYLGTLSLQDNKLKDCLIFYHKQLKTNIRSSKLDIIALSLGNLGIVYCHFGRFRKALKLFTIHLSLDLKLSNQEGAMRVYANIAHLFKIKGKFQRSEQYFKKSIKIGVKYKINRNLISVFLDYIDLLVFTNNFKKFLAINEKASLLIKNFGTLEQQALINLNSKIGNIFHRIQMGDVDLIVKTINEVKLYISGLKNDEIKAKIYFTVYKIIRINTISPSEQFYFKTRALQLYAKLYKNSRKYEYRRILQYLCKDN